MTNPTRLIRDLLMTGSIALAIVAIAPFASAEEPVPASIAPPDADAPQIEHAVYWRARGEAAREKLAEAQAELDTANAAVSRMRRRNHPRGEARIKLREERNQAELRFDAARNYLEVELPAEARAAGAPRHWLNERG